MNRLVTRHARIANPSFALSSLIALCLVLATSIRCQTAEAESPSVEFDCQIDVVYGYKDGMGLIMDVLTPKAHLNGAGVVVIASGALISSPNTLRGETWQERRPALAKGIPSSRGARSARGKSTDRRASCSVAT